MKKLNLSGKAALTKDQMKAIVGGQVCGINCINDGTLVGYVEVDHCPLDNTDEVSNYVCNHDNMFGNTMNANQSFCVCG